MKCHKLLFLPVLLLFISLESYAQIGVTGYTSYSIGFNTSPDRRISGEFKTFANRYFDNLQLEIDIYYNFKPRKYHRFSMGLGINTSPFNEGEFLEALMLPIQLEVFPIQDFKQLSIVYELSPGLEIENDILLRNMLGIRYTFTKKTESNP